MKNILTFEDLEAIGDAIDNLRNTIEDRLFVVDTENSSCEATADDDELMHEMHLLFAVTGDYRQIVVAAKSLKELAE